MVSCEPNISEAGKRQRRILGLTGFLLAALLSWWGIRNGVPWTTRLLVALPATIGAIGWLQASRGTCIRRAAEGTFERDDRSTIPVTPEAKAASLAVAKTIVRDALLIGIAAGAASAATALLR